MNCRLCVWLVEAEETQEEVTAMYAQTLTEALQERKD